MFDNKKIKNCKIIKNYHQSNEVLTDIPIKKTIALIVSFSLISFISLILKAILLHDGNLLFNQLCFFLFVALFINFLFFLIGDIHDIIVGNGIITNGTINFHENTKFKNIMFQIGDIFKWIILFGSIFISIAFLKFENDIIVAIDIFKMWLIYGIVGFGYRLRFRKSYITLLIVEVFLATLSL